MKEKFFFVTAAIVVALLLAFRHADFKKTNYQALNAFDSKKKSIIRCSPDWNELKEWIEEVNIPPIPGAGSYKWKISTKNDSAQFYFNQGINMYYSFHIIESMASFKKASQFDPGCAMLEWAQALAYGPNINDLGYAASPDALVAVGRAGELSVAECTEKEKMLIKAQIVRYSNDSTESREKLNQLYVDEMKKVYEQYPDDADVAALYADALMLQHPWDLWKNDGTAKPWTPLIREVLEKLLAKTPDHPGANHYYIHVMEPSPYAANALPSADRLGKLTPGLSHTVHMPSHIYLRTGNYNKGVSVNEDAVKSYKKTIPLYALVTSADFLYVIHNLHMQTNNAMLAGKQAYSVKSAMETVNSIQEYLAEPGAFGNYVQYIYMTPVLVDIRFGRWNELLSRTKPDPLQPYANVLYHFGTGMALANKADPEGAQIELRRLRQFLNDSSLLLPFSPFSPAIDGALVAENLLAGTIALVKKDHASAIAAFSKAVAIEDSMVYNEPRDWLLNPKQYLGDALLQAAKWEEAEKVFLRDLQNNNENGWALFGLHRSLLLQEKKAEAAKVQARFKKAFDKADVKLSAPVF